MDKKEFNKNIEKLIEPIEVGSLHFIQYFNGMLPKSIQRKLVNSSSKTSSYMGFVVDPYSYFLCYEIEDTEKARKLLPSGFKLVKTKIFDNDEPKYYCIFGCINAKTSAFFGLRVEFYIIAENEKTGLLSWIIIDYDTNTISYDKRDGLSAPNSNKSFITTHYDGTLSVNVVRNDNSRKLVFESDIKKGVMTNLDQRLWLEGNLSIGYGKDISETGDIFSLKFNPSEVEKALRIPKESLDMKINSWHKGLIKDTPSELVCFPYAQHFLSDSPGHYSNIKNKEELIKETESIDFSKVKVFSTNAFKVMFLIGSILSFTITIVLVVLLILKNH